VRRYIAVTEPAKAKSRSGSQKRQRTRHIGVCCTDEQFTAISNKADMAGVSRSAFALATMLDVPAPRTRRRPLAVNGELLARTRVDLKRFGNNLNQAVRALHQQNQEITQGGLLARVLHRDGTAAQRALEEMREGVLATLAALRRAADNHDSEG
jgi:hypothetical protein